MLLLVRLEKLDLIHFVLFVDHGQKSHPRKKKGKKKKKKKKRNKQHVNKSFPGPGGGGGGGGGVRLNILRVCGNQKAQNKMAKEKSKELPIKYFS